MNCRINRDFISIQAIFALGPGVPLWAVASFRSVTQEERLIADLRSEVAMLRWVIDSQAYGERMYWAMIETSLMAYQAPVATPSLRQYIRAARFAADVERHGPYGLSAVFTRLPMR